VVVFDDVETGFDDREAGVMSVFVVFELCDPGFQAVETVGESSPDDPECGKQCDQ
jgi:hypothetical protein